MQVKRTKDLQKQWFYQLIILIICLVCQLQASAIINISSPKNCNSLSPIINQLSGEFNKDQINATIEEVEQLYHLSDSLKCGIVVKAMNLLGYYYYNQSNLVDSKLILVKAEKLFTKQNSFDTDYFMNQNYLGLIEILAGDATLAAHHFKRCERIAREKQDTALLALANLQLGLAHLELEELEDAEQYYEQCLQFNKAINNSEHEGYSYQNLGRIYLMQKDIAKGLLYVDKANAVWEKTNNLKGIYFLQPIYADIYEGRKNYTKAIQCIERGVALHQKTGITINLDLLYFKLGHLYYLTKNFDKSAEAYKSALKKTVRFSKENQEEIVERLVEIYSRKNDMQGFKEMILSTIAANTTILELNEIKRDQLVNSEQGLDTEKEENELLKADFMREEIKLKGMSFFAIILFSLLSLISLLFYLKHRENKRRQLLLLEINDQKNELDFKNKALAKSAATIESQVKLLEGKNSELKNFAYVASHDLKAPLRTITSFTQLLRRKLGTPDKEINELLGFIEYGSKNMNELITNLLDYAKYEGSKLKIQAIKPDELLEVVLLESNALIAEKKATIETHHKVDTVYADKVYLKQVMTNLINNALKYANPQIQPVIDIELTENTDNYLFSIKDNGIGIEEDSKEKIFNMFQRSNGSEGVEGTGIGLATCKKIIELHQGKIWVESKLNEGANFKFSIPKMVLP